MSIEDENKQPEDEVIGDSETPTQNESVSETPVEEEPSIAKEEPLFKPEQKKVNFEVEIPVTKELDKEVTSGDTLSLVRESFKTMNVLLERQNQLLGKLEAQENVVMKKLEERKLPLTDKDGNLWLRTLLDSLVTAQTNSSGEDSLTREGSEWTQILEHEGVKLRAGIPKQRLSETASNSERIQFMSRKAKIGATFDVPCYQSGLWLRFSTPTLAELTALRYDLQQLKIQLGNDTKGLAFSNTSQTTSSLAVDFALQHVIEANVHYNTPADLKDKLSILDLPLVLWGLACTIWPDGYPYSHPCVADMRKCNHITRELLDVRSLFFTDRMALTKTQMKLMSTKFSRRLSDEELQQYRNEHIRGSDRLVWFGDIGLTFKVPNLLEYEEAGKSWINDLVTMTQGAFNEPPTGRNRERYINELSMVTTARQHAHWVRSIHQRDDDGNEEMVGNEDDLITEALKVIFSDPTVVEDFFEAVSKYTDDSIISMIAVPSFNCPKCNTPQAEVFNSRFEHLVPIDVLTTFFTLVNRKLN